MMSRLTPSAKPLTSPNFNDEEENQRQSIPIPITKSEKTKKVTFNVSKIQRAIIIKYNNRIHQKRKKLNLLMKLKIHLLHLMKKKRKKKKVKN